MSSEIVGKLFKLQLNCYTLRDAKSLGRDYLTP